MPDDLTTRTTQWLDRLDVSDCVRRYFLAFDRFDWDEVGRLVADEMTLAAPGLPAETSSREEFVERARRRNDGYDLTVHLNPDHVVTIDGDHAHVTSHLLVGHGVGTAPEGHFWGYGFFELELVRRSPGWAITACTVDRRHAEGGDPLTVRALAAAQFEARGGAR
jgi:ketosteroid isomerase-like protein